MLHTGKVRFSSHLWHEWASHALVFMLSCPCFPPTSTTHRYCLNQMEGFMFILNNVHIQFTGEYSQRAFWKNPFDIWPLVSRSITESYFFLTYQYFTSLLLKKLALINKNYSKSFPYSFLLVCELHTLREIITELLSMCSLIIFSSPHILPPSWFLSLLKLSSFISTFISLF